MQLLFKFNITTQLKGNKNYLHRRERKSTWQIEVTLVIQNGNVFAANDRKHYLWLREVKVSSNRPWREVDGVGSSLGIKAACGEAVATVNLELFLEFF